MPSKTSCLYATGLAALLMTTVVMGTIMEPRTVEMDGFSIIGIEVRTSNTREITKDGVIPEQWARFFKEGILEKIPHKADGSVVALYRDYASDRNGEYTYVLGAKVLDGSVVPPGMVAKKVAKSRYAVFTTERGPAAEAVPAAWRRIWHLEDRSLLGGPRTYQADFEVYDPRSNPQDSQVKIYVGIR